MQPAQHFSQEKDTSDRKDECMANYRFDDDGNEIMPKTRSVSWVNEYISGIIRDEMILQDLYVSGEISNLKYHSSGHVYFSLKDEKSEMRAAIYKSNAKKIRFNLENGMKVIAHAKAGNYNGYIQLYVDSVQPDGLGSWYFAYEQLKQRLAKEGLFDEAHKRQLPKFPERIGIITSETGAAVRDIIHVAGRRYPPVKLILFPSSVQGITAAEELVRAVEYFNIMNNVDVIILGRGGGSIEDLWAFNDECLARAVYNSHIPVISAVGHEVDFTICDFVADVRAATPSAAAEIATPDISELQKEINSFMGTAYDSLKNTISGYKDKLKAICKTGVMKNPKSLFEKQTERFSTNAENLKSGMNTLITSLKNKLMMSVGKLDALNPMAVLLRGYGAIFDSDGKVLKSICKVKKGEIINVRLSDGTITAAVTDTERSK